MINLGCGQVQRRKEKNKVCCNHWLCDRCLAFYAMVLGAGIIFALVCYNLPTFV